MDQKFQEFQNYNFTRSPEWQTHLEGLYPKPDYRQLTKIKKRWYQRNIDKDFDVNYDPSNPEAPRAQPAPGPQAQQQRAQGADLANMAEQQFHQIRAQTQQIPLNLFSHIKTVLLLAYAVLFPLRFNVGGLILAAVLVDLLRKFGPPKCNKYYFSQLALDDELHSLSLVLFTSFVNNFIFTIPIYFFIFQCLVAYFFQLYRKNPAAPLAGMLKPHVDKFFFKRGQIRGLRAEIEIYSGIYLIVGIFIGTSGMFQALIFWQFLRMLYMVNGYTKWGFRRLGAWMDSVVANPRVPGIIKTLFTKIKGGAAWMTQMEQGGQAGGAGGGPRCAVF